MSESTEPVASEGSTPEDTDDGAGGGWTVDTSRVSIRTGPTRRSRAPSSIGSSGPLSGGPAAAAFAPVIAGYQAYIDYANENGLLPDHELSVTYGDDQFDPALTPGVINAALDDGAHVISGMIGAPNAFAVRDALNEECVPQLMVGGGPPALNDPVAYPWTMGALLPFTVEAKAYAEDIVREFPDGATRGGLLRQQRGRCGVRGRASSRPPGRPGSRSSTPRQSNRRTRTHRPRS